jgi:16S rRNA (cytosine967-C5)-methyltransferase
VGVVDSLIAAGLPIQRVPVLANELGDWGDFLTTAGDLRTLPCHLGDAGGIDGFYAARLRRH